MWEDLNLINLLNETEMSELLETFRNQTLK